jgi:hypothetical protein
VTLRRQGAPAPLQSPARTTQGGRTSPRLEPCSLQQPILPTLRRRRRFFEELGILPGGHRSRACGGHSRKHEGACARASNALQGRSDLSRAEHPGTCRSRRRGRKFCRLRNRESRETGGCTPRTRGSQPPPAGAGMSLAHRVPLFGKDTGGPGSAACFVKRRLTAQGPQAARGS